MSIPSAHSAFLRMLQSRRKRSKRVSAQMSSQMITNTVSMVLPRGGPRSRVGTVLPTVLCRARAGKVAYHPERLRVCRTSRSQRVQLALVTRQATHRVWPSGDGYSSGMSERGEQNEIGYRNVDEDAQHDEAGSQGKGREIPDEQQHGAGGGDSDAKDKAPGA